MQNSKQKKQNKNSFFNKLLGEPNEAKASGMTFSLAVIVPVILSFLFLIVIGALGLGSADVTQKNWYVYVSFLITPCASVLVATLYFAWTKKSIKTAIIEQKCHPKYFFWAILLQFGLMSLSELNTLFVDFLGKLGYKDSSMAGVESLIENTNIVFLILVLAILPAVLEEVIFRGLLLKGLKGFGTVGAILICGGLFALYHQNPAQTIYQFCCGAAFALIAVKSGSILPTVLSHFVNNLLVIVLAKLGVASFPLPVFIIMIIVFSLCLVGSLIYLIFFDKKGSCTQRMEKVNKKEKKGFWIFSAFGIIICAVSWVSMLVSGIVGA